MDKSSFIRDASKVHQDLVEQKDGSVVTKKGCKIYIPARFTERGLAAAGTVVNTVSIYAIAVGNYYGVSVAPITVGLSPSSTTVVTFDEDDYLEFSFDPGSVVFPSTELVQNDTLLYKIFDEIIAMGYCPWYVGYEDMGKLFTESAYYAGPALGSNNSVLELIASSVARDPDNLNQYYRQGLKSLEQVKSKPPEFIALRNIQLGATNTTAKLLGAYFDEGLTAALVNPSTRNERVEDLLRK